MLTMAELTRHFGITSNDLSNWVKRGRSTLGGQRGVERVFDRSQRQALLTAIFARACSYAGMPLDAAFIHGGDWAKLAESGDLHRFFAWSPITEASIAFDDPAVLNHGLMETVLEDDDDVTGYSDEPRGSGFPAVLMTVIDRGAIVARLDALLEEPVEQAKTSAELAERLGEYNRNQEI